MKWIDKVLEKRRMKKIARQKIRDEQNAIAHNIITKIKDTFDWKLLVHSGDRKFTYKNIVAHQYNSGYDDIWYGLFANGAEIKCNDDISRSFYHYLETQHNGNTKERIEDAIHQL